MQNASADMQERYLERIGLCSNEIAVLIGRSPNEADVQLLLTRHLATVPFENLDQHSHPADSEVPAIERRRVPASLDVHRSLTKIVERRRGGFCFEINLAFSWLLRSLGYRVRLTLADVGCRQRVPSHVAILVDGIAETAMLVDPGFGDPPRRLLEMRHGMPAVADSHSDDFRIEHERSSARFDSVLLRRRKVASGARHLDWIGSVSSAVAEEAAEEAVYRFCAADDLAAHCCELEAGLAYVLTSPETFFTQKRLCVLGSEGGHVSLCGGYIKWVEGGETVSVRYVCRHVYGYVYRRLYRHVSRYVYGHVYGHVYGRACGHVCGHVRAHVYEHVRRCSVSI